jgi:hypothetical protein
MQSRWLLQAVEYLGPPPYTAEYADEIRAIFANAATFGQGSRWTPTPLKWVAYVRCDDWDGRCRKSPNKKAYTVNRMGDKDADVPNEDDHHRRDTSTPTITFCPTFFRLQSLAEQIRKHKNEKDITVKYNLEYYISRGTLTFPFESTACL